MSTHTDEEYQQLPTSVTVSKNNSIKHTSSTPVQIIRNYENDEGSSTILSKKERERTFLTQPPTESEISTSVTPKSYRSRSNSNDSTNYETNGQSNRSIKLDLYNFTDKDLTQSCPYVLTSPRSLKACSNRNVRPIDLLSQSLQDFIENNPEQGGKLTFDGMKRLWRRQEDVKRILLNQCRMERARLMKVDSAKSNLASTIGSSLGGRSVDRGMTGHSQMTSPAPSRSLSASLQLQLEQQQRMKLPKIVASPAKSLYTDIKLAELMKTKRSKEKRDRDDIFKRNLEYSKQIELEKQQRNHQQQELNRLIKKSQERWHLHQQARRNLQKLKIGGSDKPLIPVLRSGHSDVTNDLALVGPISGSASSTHSESRNNSGNFGNNQNQLAIKFDDGNFTANSFAMSSDSERRALRHAKAAHIRQVKKQKQVQELIYENQTAQERVLAKRAILQAENDLAIESAKNKAEYKIETAVNNLGSMFEAKQNQIAKRASEQEKKIVESHTRKLQKEAIEKDYYELLVDQKQNKIKQARKKVEKLKLEKAKERVEVTNARTQRHTENLEKVLARGVAENAILNENLREKNERSVMFKAYKEALAEDSKAYAWKSRAEREVIRNEGRTFDQMNDHAQAAAWIGQGSGTGRVNLGEIRLL